MKNHKELSCSEYIFMCKLTVYICINCFHVCTGNQYPLHVYIYISINTSTCGRSRSVSMIRQNTNKYLLAISKSS